MQSIRDAFSRIFDVADPTGAVTLDSPAWVPGWHAPLLKLIKDAINAKDIHHLHRLDDDLFAELQDRLASRTGASSAFKMLLSNVADYFDRAARQAALETLRRFSVCTGTPLSSYLWAFRVVVASAVEKVTLWPRRLIWQSCWFG